MRPPGNNIIKVRQSWSNKCLCQYRDHQDIDMDMGTPPLITYHTTLPCMDHLSHVCLPYPTLETEQEWRSGVGEHCIAHTAGK